MNSIASLQQQTVFDPESILGDFPILQQRIHNNRRLIYLDNAASTQRPVAVIDAMNDCYTRYYANVHRGIHHLSETSTAAYENAREKIRELLNADKPHEIIFTSGTTASINLVAHSWGSQNVRAGDEILLTEMEHHSNIVPWQQLAARTGATIRWVRVSECGHLDLDHYRQSLSDRTRVVAVTAISNMLGTRNPIREIVAAAHQAGAVCLVDAAQQVPHEPSDVQDWQADFVAFSAHKMLGPSGIGVLYGREQLLEQMPPFMGGGSMISTVTTEGFTPGFLPAKFEAGTPPIAEAIGFGAAINYLQQIGMARIAAHEQRLIQPACQRLSEIDGATVFGPPAEQRAGIVSFIVDGVHPQDLAVFADRRGVAIRVGHHCTMPLHQKLGISASCRMSFYLYNTETDVEEAVSILDSVVHKLR